MDDAMGAIERENPTLKGVLPRDYARPSLDTATRDRANPDCDSHWRDFGGAKDHVRLGGLVDMISNIGFVCRPGALTRHCPTVKETPGEGTGPTTGGGKDVLGHVYE